MADPLFTHPEKLDLRTGVKHRTQYRGAPLGFSPDGAELVTLLVDEAEDAVRLQRYHLMEASTTEVQLPVPRDQFFARYCAAIEEVLLSSGPRSYRLVSAKSGKLKRRFARTRNEMMWLPTFSHAGRWLVFGFRNGAILYERRNGRYEEFKVIPIGAGFRAPRALSFSPDEKLLAISSLEHFAYVIDLESENLTPNRIGHSKRGIQGLTFSPDSRSLIWASDDYSIRTWNVETGRELMTLSMVNNPTYVKLSLNAKWLLATTGSETPNNPDGLVWWPVKK